MFNKMLIVANLAADPELRYTANGTAVCNLRIASSNRFKAKDGQDKEDKLFITAVVWSKRAENCNEYLSKGSHIFVEGRLVTREWETQDGQKRSTIEMIVDNIQFLDRVKEGTSPETK